MHTPIRTLGTLPAPAFHRPWLRYIDPVDGAGGDGKPKDEDLGFPKETPVEQMTPEQQVAYWKNQSKTQQKAREDAEKRESAYKGFGSPEELQAAADAAEQARLANLNDQQRAIEEAKAAGRAEAEATSSTKHLGTAVTGMLIALTKGANESFKDASERVSGAIEFADLNKFIGDNGELDATKIQTFAQSIGSTGGDNGEGPNEDWGARHRREHEGRVPRDPGATGSVASMEQAAYDRMKNKTTA